MWNFLLKTLSDRTLGSAESRFGDTFPVSVLYEIMTEDIEADTPKSMTEDIGDSASDPTTTRPAWE